MAETHVTLVRGAFSRVWARTPESTMCHSRVRRVDQALPYCPPPQQSDPETHVTSFRTPDTGIVSDGPRTLRCRAGADRPHDCCKRQELGQRPLRQPLAVCGLRRAELGRTVETIPSNHLRDSCVSCDSELQ